MGIYHADELPPRDLVIFIVVAFVLCVGSWLYPLAAALWAWLSSLAATL